MKMMEKMLYKLFLNNIRKSAIAIKPVSENKFKTFGIRINRKKQRSSLKI